MTRKYQIKYHFNSNWTPTRAKNFVRYMGLKSTNFDDNMNILSQKYGCTSQELQKQIDPYKFCLKVFKNNTYLYHGKFIRNYVADRILPKHLLSDY